MTPVSTDAKRKSPDASRASSGPLSAEELRKIHASWRAANYLSVGQIYLMDNPLLKEPLRLEHVKPRLLGHWETTSGQIIKAYDLNVLYVSGPGQFGSSAPTWSPSAPAGLLIVACVVGDGEAETGPLAAGWHSNKFLNPARDGAVLPILHLNGYKIANPTILSRIPTRSSKR
jgi:xylulose-5-phosphate/fructose-6-phosphate phosphoketolase